VGVVFVLICFSHVGLADSSEKNQIVHFDVSLKHEVEHTISLGVRFLAENQQQNGSWSHYPGITGLVLTAILNAPDHLRQKYALEIDNGFKFLNDMIHPNGGIYPEEEPQLRAYNTSICLMAYVSADNPEYKDIIINARDYLLSLQADEDEGITPDSSVYGGIGYNRDERSDISNMQMALEALRMSEDYKPESEFDGRIEYRGDVER
jgi:squalene-hopene/tetraprenyl-beta-curcumene cyclase